MMMKHNPLEIYHQDSTEKYLRLIEYEERDSHKHFKLVIRRQYLPDI